MGQFKLDATTKPGVLILRFEGALTPDELRTWQTQVQDAVDALRGAPYRIFIDLRKVHPLSPESTTVFQEWKAAGARQPNFQGSAVLVSSSLVAMQHRRTSVASGVMDSELISEDETACWEHLRNVQRRPR